ncbi:centromere protein H (CENP-H)-domain-containing protein [Hypoxylon sp. NC1633]|nr:centromere protein H (CENP-H)-domain-containing protein [Hypoxylon sp. NC1633]
MPDEITYIPPGLLLSPEERRILELHDQLRHIQQTIAVVVARKEYDPSTSPENGTEEEAKKALLDSRARYALRNQVVESVISAKPVLVAVHEGAKAPPIERDMRTVLEERDEESSKLAQQSTEMRALLDEITEVESQSLRVGRENVGLASKVLDLADQMNRRKEIVNTSPEQAAEISRLEDQVKISRQRWRVLKDTASAIVAGSGIDWPRDAELRDIVLDPENDDEV